MQRYFNMRPHLLSRLATIYSQLGDLYDRLDKKRAGRPSDERDQAITELAKDIEAGEKLLKAAKLEETEGGVGGDKPPGGKPPATAEQPHEEGDQPEDREAIFRREIGDTLSHPSLSEIDRYQEALASGAHHFREGEHPFGVLPALDLTGIASFAIRGDFKDALMKSRDVNLDHLLVEGLSVLAALGEPSAEALHHLEVLGRECKAENWPGVREKLAVIKALCKE